MKTYPEDIKVAVGLSYKKWMDNCGLEETSDAVLRPKWFFDVVKEDAKKMIQIANEISDEYDQSQSK